MQVRVPHNSVRRITLELSCSESHIMRTRARSGWWTYTIGTRPTFVLSLSKHHRCLCSKQRTLGSSGRLAFKRRRKDWSGRYVLRWGSHSSKPRESSWRIPWDPTYSYGLTAKTTQRRLLFRLPGCEQGGGEGQKGPGLSFKKALYSCAVRSQCRDQSVWMSTAMLSVSSLSWL